MAPRTSSTKVVGNKSGAANSAKATENKHSGNDIGIADENGDDNGDDESRCDGGGDDITNNNHDDNVNGIDVKMCSDNIQDGDDKDENDDVPHNDDHDDDGDDDYEEDYSDIPVDRGRAWLVMISCFLMHVLVVGGGKSFGVFVQEFQDRFNVGAKELGVINGMALMLMLGLGIFVNMLAVRFSARRVVIAGSVLSSTGFVMTAFIPSFNWLYVTYGIVTGLGFALSFSPTIVMIGQCFEKYRPVAFGFAVSGAGLGAFAFPGLSRLLINQYGLRGCLLVIGGLMFNVAICGFLLPPHRRTSKKNKQCHKVKDEEDGRNPLVTKNEQEKMSRKDIDYKNDVDFLEKLDVDMRERLNKNDVKTRMGTLSDPLTSFKIHGDMRIEVVENIDLELEMIHSPESENEMMLSDRREVQLLRLHSDPLPKLNESGSCIDVAIPTESQNLSKSANHLHVECPNLVDNDRHDLPYNETRKDRSISTSYLPELFKRDALHVVQNAVSKQSQNRISSSLAYVSNCDLAMASQGNLERLSMMTSMTSIGPVRDDVKRIRGKKPMFEWSLLRDLPFIMHFFSVYMGYTCYITNLFMLADYAYTCGLDRDTAALTLSVVGILETVARLTFPLTTEVLCCQRRITWAMSLALMGVLNIAVLKLTSLSGLMAYSVAFGYSCGCFTALIPVLCAEIKGSEKMGSSFGLTTIGMGLAVMTGPPLSGTIKDVTGFWDYGFVSAGILAFLASALAFLEPTVEKRWDSR